MKYTLTSNPEVIRRDDGAWIPTDPDNGDYLEYLRWLDKGNEPGPGPNAPAPAYEPPTPYSAPRLTGQPEKRR